MIIAVLFLMTGSAWAKTKQNQGKDMFGNKPAFQTNTGARYEYNLSDPGDKIKYDTDPAAQIRDKVRMPTDPRVNIDRGSGQYGGGILDNNMFDDNGIFNND
ncbi:hypothetical protein [Desulfobacter postgatei]|uniref:hypothetical protein n=1 Tax=Desulfobacter postgatei TaxID=2293 RepID=UPI002FDA3AF6